MATLTRGATYGATETLTNTKLHNLVDLGSIAGITNADCDANMQLANSKLANVTSAGKISGSSMFNLASIPSGAGVIPAANAIPSGVILLWSGTIASIPTGFVICDGNNGTPDLTGKFIIHADADSGGTHDVGDTPTVVSAHTHSTPAHGHTLKTNGDATGRNFLETANGTIAQTTDYVVSSGSGTTGSTGSQTAYALAYIMKT